LEITPMQDRRAREIIREIESLGFAVSEKTIGRLLELRAVCRVTGEEFVATCDEEEPCAGACELWERIDLDRLIGPPPGDPDEFGGQTA
jgi:hypothetical protein